MSEPKAERKRESVVAVVFCGLGMALSFLALASRYIPMIGDRIALLISLLAILLAILCLAFALVRNTRLVLPVITLLFAATPAASQSLHEMRTVWVESQQLCSPPRLVMRSVLGIIGSMAAASDYRDAIGNNVCGQLGKRYTDYECDRRVGRMKCEP